MKKITTVGELIEMLSGLDPGTKIFDSEIQELQTLQESFYRAQEEVYDLEDCKIWLVDNGYSEAAKNEELVADLHSYYKNNEDSNFGIWDNIGHGFQYIRDVEEYATLLKPEYDCDNDDEE